MRRSVRSTGHARSLATFFLVASVLLSACDHGSPQDQPEANESNSRAGSGALETRSGQSYDIYLDSLVDGETIAFTVHEPDQLQVGAGYPLLLHSHGYGGTRTNADDRGSGESFDGRALASGYGILSLDERGHGESGGLIRVLDPDYAGADWLQVLDWVEQNLAWVMVRTDSEGRNNPVLGSYGGSYGGGFQHLIYRIDEKDRLDAMAPDITWHNLNDSLYPNRVFKSYWGTLLSAGGNVLANGQHPDVNAGLALALASNQLTAEQQALLYKNSIAANCEGRARPLRKIDALYSQSAGDTLFNFNEAVRNFECISAFGGDVRIAIKPAGHSGGDHNRCGDLEMDDARLAFFNEKLYQRRGEANFVPRFCFHLGMGGDDAVTLDHIPKGQDIPESDSIVVSAQNLVLHELQDQLLGATTLDLGITIGDDGAALVGIPAIDITVTDPLLGLDGALDPILFVALGRSTDNGASWEALMDQVRPFRGYGRFVDELVGVSVKLEPGDQLGLMLYPAYSLQYPSSASAVPTPVNVDAKIRVPLVDLQP